MTKLSTSVDGGFMWNFVHLRTGFLFFTLILNSIEIDKVQLDKAKMQMEDRSYMRSLSNSEEDIDRIISEMK